MVRVRVSKIIYFQTNKVTTGLKLQGEAMGPVFIQARLEDNLVIKINPQVIRWFRRRIRVMGVRIMNPKKKGLIFMGLEPGKNPFVDFAGMEIPPVGRKGIFIKIESFIKTEGSAKDTQGNKCRSRIPIFFEQVDEWRPVSLALDFLAVIVILDGIRRLRKKDGSVRGEGNRNKGISLVKINPFAGQPVKVGRLDNWGVDQTQIISPLGIQGNQDNPGRSRKALATREKEANTYYKNN